MSSGFEEWPRDREPAPPASFDPWADQPMEDDPVQTLLDAGLECLDRAVRGAPEDRKAAFLLLEADGYLTYACEAATDAVAAEELLLEILDRIGSRSR